MYTTKFLKLRMKGFGDDDDLSEFISRATQQVTGLDLKSLNIGGYMLSEDMLVMFDNVHQKGQLYQHLSYI